MSKVYVSYCLQHSNCGNKKCLKKPSDENLKYRSRYAWGDNHLPRLGLRCGYFIPAIEIHVESKYAV